MSLGIVAASFTDLIGPYHPRPIDVNHPDQGLPLHSCCT